MNMLGSDSNANGIGEGAADARHMQHLQSQLQLPWRADLTWWSTESQESDALLTKYQVGTSHQICVRRTTRETFAVLPEGRNWRSNWLQNRERTKAAKALGSSIAFAFLAVLATYIGRKRGRRMRQAVAA
jgi:hypothetical protein